MGYLALVRLAKLALYTLGHLFEILAPDGMDAALDKDFRYVLFLPIVNYDIYIILY